MDTNTHERPLEDNWADYPELTQHVAWSSSKDLSFFYTANVGGEKWDIRLGDFPDEPFYTLIRDQYPNFQFNDWPSFWEKPL